MNKQEEGWQEHPKLLRNGAGLVQPTATLEPAEQGRSRRDEHDGGSSPSLQLPALGPRLGMQKIRGPSGQAQAEGQGMELDDKICLFVTTSLRPC